MAFKTLTQVQNLVRQLVAMAMLEDVFLDQAFLYRIEKIKDAIEAGDDAPENAAMINAMNVMATRAGEWRESLHPLMRASYRALGRFAGAPDAMQEDEFKHLDYWIEYLRAQDKKYQKRGLTRPSTGTFTGSGAGKMSVLAVGLNGKLIDCGHIDTITFRCELDQSNGAAAGQQEFLVSGLARTWPWQEGGIGVQAGDYKHPYSRVAGDPIPVIASAGQRIAAVPATNGIVNILSNGDFEQAFVGTGTDKIPSWPLTAGTIAHWLAETTDPINGVGSITTTSDGKLAQNIPDGKMRSGGYYGISLKAMVHSTGTPGVTGTVTVKIMDRDEGTTHGTLTLDLATLVNDVKTIIQPAVFALPNNAEQLKCVVELASLGGTGTGKTVHLDDVCVSEARMVDGLVVFISDGSYVSSGNVIGRFVRGDKFTLATTSTDAGKTEKLFANRSAGRGMNVDTSADAGYEDPEEIPGIDLSRNDATVDPDTGLPPLIEDNGSDAMGAGLATPFTKVYTVVNNGLYPLIIDNIAFSAETNVAGAVDTAPPQCIRPGESGTFVIEFTPAGTGAISSTVTIEFNDPAGNPDDLDFVFTATGTAT
jgi:hypothetical protein